MRHLPGLDGLRAIAVLAVVLYHAGVPVPAGYVGVDVFFVISGYLITRLLHEELRGGRVDFMAFYARRARRILPALAVVIAGTLVASLLLLPDASGVAQSAAAAGAFVANLYFQSQTSDYWAQASDSMPLLHLWSLSVEEQFYLVWPVLLVLARRRPAAALATVALASLIAAEWWLVQRPSAAFYQMPARAWELALGGLVALRPFAVPKGAGWLGLAIVLVACVVPVAHFPGLGALPAVAGAALLIQAIQGGQRMALLERRPMIFVGLISYSLYLWHWPLLALNRELTVGTPSLSSRLLLVGLAFVLAVLSYRFVETPVRRSRIGNRFAVATAVVCLATLSGAAWAMVRPAPPLVPVFRVCVAGQMQSPACFTHEPKDVVWGDSYAHSWSPLILAVASRDRLPAVAFIREYCPPFADVTLPRRDAVETRDCRARNDKAIAYLQANGADTVLLTTRWTDYSEAQIREGLGNTVRAISPHVRHILIMGPTPEVLDAGPKCIAYGVSCAIEREEFARQAAPAWRALRDLQQRPNVEVVDAGSWLCDAGRCPGVRDGHPLYRDNRHVTADTARAFAADWLRQRQ